MIEFDIDWYGTYNRRSAVADYLEILALAGHRISLEYLADVIRDMAWVNLLGERIVDGDKEARNSYDEEYDDSDLVEAQSDATDRAGDVRLVLQERSDLLRTRYPFDVDQDGAVITHRPHGSFGPYLSLLALTVSHAARLTGIPRDPVYVFEDSLALTLNTRGLSTACLGALSRGGAGFGDTLINGCALVGLKADPRRAPHRVFANEEGADTISNWWPDDPRLGGVQFVGQATCAKSNEWKSKLMEPPVGHWEDWLMRKLAPVAFLSVPHHVEEDTLGYLIRADRKRDVLDRIRLATVDRELLDDEVATIEAMLAHEPVPL